MKPENGSRKANDERDYRVRLDDIPDSGLTRAVLGGLELVEAYLPEGEADFELLKPIRAEFRLQRQGREVQVEGRVETRLSVPCDRCLASIEQPVDTKVRLIFMPQPEVSEGGQLDLGEDDLETEFYGPDHVIDLGAVVVEELELAVPYRVLCKEACRGLCPGCGADLNREECRCGPKVTDPRLARLKDLKID
jgi:uncharacterized protein